MGLIVSVYRSAHGDSSNQGLCHHADDLCVVNVPGPFEPNDRTPPVLLERGPLGNPIVVGAYRDADGRYLPTVAPGQHGPMFGGSYAATSDSRWSRAVGFYGAVPIHDRWESPELYEAISR